MKGTFTARACGWELTKSKNKGTEEMLVKFVLDDGTYVYWDGWLTEKAWARTVDSLKACGWDGVSMETMEGMGTLDVELVLEEEEYEGVTRTKVKWVNPIGGAPMKVSSPMTGDERRRFLAKMQARLKQAGPAAAPKPAQKTSAPVQDDDIPF